MTGRSIWIAALLTACAAFGVRAEQPLAVVATWDREAAAELVRVVERISQEGLDAGGYDAATLQTALATDDAIGVSIAASALFAEIATDLLEGTIEAADRRNWFIDGATANESLIAAAMDDARNKKGVESALRSFEPTHPQYKALRASLANVPLNDPEARARLLLNLDRWRWMPRDLGPEYILVNVPAFELSVVRNGEVVDQRRIIIGSKDTPTPQFAAMASGVIFHPIWHVPDSIAAEGIGALLASNPEEAARQGYYAAPDGRVRQEPGPKNALGRVKLDMPNGYSIFVHDTPAQNLFDRESRALSHGCIRVESALNFVQALLPEWDDEAIADVVEAGPTVTVPLDRPIPIYVVYFTAVAETDGSVSFFPDIYGLDRALLPKFGAPITGVAAMSETAVAGCPAAG